MFSPITLYDGSMIQAAQMGRRLPRYGREAPPSSPQWLILLFLFTACLSPLAAQKAPSLGLPALSSLIPPPALAELQKKGNVVRVQKGSNAPNLAPSSPAFAAFRRAIAAEKPGLFIESLYLYPRAQPANPQAELRSLYSTILAISSLEGIQYYSASHRSMRVFYSESYRIDGPDTRRRQADALAPAGNLPSAETYYAFQRDTTFGPNVYRCAYRSYEEAVSLESINLTNLSFMGIPVLKAEGLRIRLFIVQASEGIIFYVVNSAEAPGLPLVLDKVQESISNRTAALFKWFEARQSR